MKRETRHKDFRSAEMEPVRYWDRDNAPVNKELPAAAAAESHCFWAWTLVLLVQSSLLPSGLIIMEFTGSSQKQENPQGNGPLNCKRGEVTFPWVKLVGKLSFAKLYVSICTQGVTLTAGEIISLQFLCRTLRFSSANLVTWIEDHWQRNWAWM